MSEWVVKQRFYGLQSLKYLPFDPLQKKVANSDEPSNDNIIDVIQKIDLKGLLYLM